MSTLSASVCILDVDVDGDDEYTNLCLSSLFPAAFYSYIPHFPSSFSFSLSHYTLIVIIIIIITTARERRSSLVGLE